MAHSTSTGNRSEIPSEVVAQPVSLEMVKSSWISSSSRAGYEVLQMLMPEVGGIMIVIVNAAQRHELRMKSLDERCLFQCFKKDAPNIFQNPTQFKTILKASCTHCD